MRDSQSVNGCFHILGDILLGGEPVFSAMAPLAGRFRHMKNQMNQVTTFLVG